MKVFVPYVEEGLRALTWAEVSSQAPQATAALLSLDPEAYYWWLREKWEAGKGFILVEQDVVPPKGAIAGFVKCPKPLCAHQYLCAPSLVVALGCTKFSGWLVRALPNLMAEVGEMGGVGDGPGFDGLPKRHWKRLDVRVLAALAKHDIRPHVHFPPARHLHYEPEPEPEPRTPEP